jgi:dissimilatory sulfite reductase (desulfoviridin) alpha/beta subunit
MRIRNRAGNMTAAGLRKVAELAEQYGAGVVHVTTRQALEIPGVAEERFEQALKAVEAAGLLSAVCGPRIRPIVACPGTDTCPYGLQNTRTLAEALDQQWVGRDVPSKTKIAISGCPNSCTKPQANDLGLKGVAEPLVDQALCIQCGACVRRCPAKCMRIQDQTLMIDYGQCLACGVCIGLCKKKALSVGRQGFHVYIGGKGGRYPRTGELGATFVSEKEIRPFVEAVLLAYQETAEKGERIAAVLARVGLPAFQAKVTSKLVTS